MSVSEPLRKSSTPVRVLAVHEGVAGERPDVLATEEPMEIRAAGPDQELQAVAVTMRTPGGDFELAVGFLFTEGRSVSDGTSTPRPRVGSAARRP